MLQKLHEIFDNKYFSTTLILALGLYASLLGPELPESVKNLFNNTIFRILVLFLVVVRGNKDPKMSIMLAIVFVLTLDYIYAKSATETFGLSPIDEIRKYGKYYEPIPLYTMGGVPPPEIIRNKTLFKRDDINHIKIAIKYYSDVYHNGYNTIEPLKKIVTLSDNINNIRDKINNFRNIISNAQKIINTARGHTAKERINQAKDDIKTAQQDINKEMDSATILIKDFHIKFYWFLAENNFPFRFLVPLDVFTKAMLN